MRKAILIPMLLVEISAAPGSPDAAIVPTGFIDEEVVAGLDEPTSFDFLPDGRILVTEFSSGSVRVIAGTSLSPAILTVSGLSIGHGRGLLGIAVDPAWPARPYIYLHFTHATNTIHVRMYTASGDLSDPGSLDLVLHTPYEVLTDAPDLQATHNGGTLRFGPDGMLYVSLGDDDNRCEVQLLSRLQGKLLRLDVSALPGAGGGPPPRSLITPSDNPFPGPDDNARLVYAYGLRNPFRFHVDDPTGLIYIADVGASSWEEADECAGGENFGWPKREGMHDYAGGIGCPGTAGTDPIHEYDATMIASASIVSARIYHPVASGGGLYNFPAPYDGDFFFIDHFEGFMRRLERGPGGWALAAPVPGQPDATNWGLGFVNAADFLGGPDGALYYVKLFGPGSLRRVRHENATSVGPGDRGFKRTELGLEVSPSPCSAGVPFSISFETSMPGMVDLSLYTVRGARVATLHAGFLEAGPHHFRDTGALAPGLYVVRLKTPEGSSTRKVAFVR